MEFFDLSEASQAKKYWILSFYLCHFYYCEMNILHIMPVSLLTLMASKLCADMLLSVIENLKLEGTLSIL